MMRLSPLSFRFHRDLLDTGMEVTMLALEANMVVAYRSGAFCGFRPMSGDEVHRMYAEKPPAFAASALAAGFTAFGGQRPDQVVAAAVHPLRSETNRNLRRLGGDSGA